MSVVLSLVAERDDVPGSAWVVEGSVGGRVVGSSLSVTVSAVLVPSDDEVVVCGSVVGCCGVVDVEGSRVVDSVVGSLVEETTLVWVEGMVLGAIVVA